MKDSELDIRFSELFRLYYNDIYAFLLKLCGYDSALAEEISQEAFLHAYFSLFSFSGKSSVKSWLTAIAKNRFYSTVRKKRIYMVPFEDVQSLLCDIQNISEKLEDRQLVSDAWQIINSMKNQMRDVMVYRICSDMSYKQISDVMSISESSAKVLFFRGKHLLQDRLREEYGYEI